MSTVKVIDPAGKAKGDVDLPAEIFDVQVNVPLIHQVVVAQLAAARQGTHDTKTRGEVSGGGKKPYKQKGTGRAQAGSSRSPLWRKGGTVFGPQPRSYTYQLPKKVERGALRAALQSRLKDGVVTVVDALAMPDVKTKAAVALLKSLGATGKTLVIDVKLDENFVLSARNIAGVRMVASGRLTARDVMNTGRVVATRAAIERLQEVLG